MPITGGGSGGIRGGGCGAGGNGGGGGGDGKGDGQKQPRSGAGPLGMLLKGWEERVAYDPEFPVKMFIEQVRRAQPTPKGMGHGLLGLLAHGWRPTPSTTSFALFTPMQLYE